MISSFELLILTCFIFLSAFLSASEVAIFSLSRFQIRQLKDQFPPAYRRIKQLLTDPNGLLITILVSNEVINVTLATFVEHWVIKTWSTTGGQWVLSLPFHLDTHTPLWFQQMLIGTLLTTAIVLLLCDVTPKVVAAKANHVVAPLTSTTLLWLHYALKPVRASLAAIIRLLLGRRRKKIVKANPNEEPLFKEDDFLVMVEEGHKQGIVHSSELELIRNIFELDDTRVEEVCTPIGRVFSIPAKTTLKQALEYYRLKKYSRIPVFEKDKNNIVGILFVKDLIPSRLDSSLQSQPVEQCMNRPLLIEQGTRLNTVFRTMRQNHTHMVVVTNPRGQAIGVVTMSDLLGEIFGEFFESGTTIQPSPGKERTQ